MRKENVCEDIFFFGFPSSQTPEEVWLHAYVPYKGIAEMWLQNFG